MRPEEGGEAEGGAGEAGGHLGSQGVPQREKVGGFALGFLCAFGVVLINPLYYFFAHIL